MSSQRVDLIVALPHSVYRALKVTADLDLRTVADEATILIDEAMRKRREALARKMVAHQARLRRDFPLAHPPNPDR